MMQQQQTTFLVEDETKLVDLYLTRNPREVTLLAKVKKLYIYIRGQADNSNCPATFEDFYDWIGPNQLVVNQVTSRYFNDVVIELDRKAIYTRLLQEAWYERTFHGRFSRPCEISRSLICVVKLKVSI